MPCMAIGSVRVSPTIMRGFRDAYGFWKMIWIRRLYSMNWRGVSDKARRRYPLEPLIIRSENDLLAQLRRGVDGLLIEEEDLAATFLPSMWPRLPEPRAFVRALKEKAHLPADYWSERIRAFRYTAEEL